jgi:hypothetical protein
LGVFWPFSHMIIIFLAVCVALGGHVSERRRSDADN